MFLGVHKSHVSWIPKFPTHESAHGPRRRALPFRIALELEPDLRNSPVWGNFGDTFLEPNIRVLQRMQGALTGQIQKLDFSNCSKLESHAHTCEGERNVWKIKKEAEEFLRLRPEWRPPE